MLLASDVTFALFSPDYSRKRAAHQEGGGCSANVIKIKHHPQNL
jgi:hypothetical protein